MRKHRKRLWKFHGNYWFCYLGNHRWYNPKSKRIYWFNKRTNTFISPAPKKSKGLTGLKSWWKSYRKKKYGK